MLWSNDSLGKMCDTERDERVSPNSIATIGKTWHNAAFLSLQTVPDNLTWDLKLSERVF